MTMTAAAEGLDPVQMTWLENAGDGRQTTSEIDCAGVDQPPQAES